MNLHETSNQQRRRLLGALRAMLGVKYDEPASIPPPDIRPLTTDCSTVICIACRTVFGRLDWLDPYAPSMWAPSAWGMYHQDLDDSPQGDPEPGDLAFYSRTNPDYNEGSQGREEFWHVMMVTDRGGVVGACDEKREVHEYEAVEYGKRWQLRGFRRMRLQ